MMWDPTEHYRDANVAEEYDAIRFFKLSGRFFNFLEKRVILRGFAGLPRGDKIVDIPCGTGRLAEPLLEAGYLVHGMDISDEMLTVARRRPTRFRSAFTTEVADARELQKPDELFDAALCARVLMHFDLEEQTNFLSGVAKLVSKRVVINQSLSSPYQRFRRAIKRVLQHQPSAQHPVTNAEIRELLTRSGLREARRLRLASPISEAIYLIAEPLSLSSD